MKTAVQRLPFIVVVLMFAGILGLFLYSSAKATLVGAPPGGTSPQPPGATEAVETGAGSTVIIVTPAPSGQTGPQADPAEPPSLAEIEEPSSGNAGLTPASSLPPGQTGPQTDPAGLPSPAAAGDPAGLWRAIDHENNHAGSLTYYCGANVEIGGGRIVITSKKETRGQKSYTSGKVESTECFLYGSYSFKIRKSAGIGLFPAIWMMPADSKLMPEIDIFEMIGRKPNDFYGVLHYMDSGIQTREYFSEKVAAKESYVVGLRWTKSELKWYIDGKCLLSVKKGVPQEYMYLIINQAVGSDWAGVPDKSTVFPCTFIIESYNIRPESRRAR